jgi:hypothetical protein
MNLEKKVWDRNGFLGLGMSDLCRYTRGAFTCQPF